MSGLVSVVVPAFDEERFIAEALESVSAQTYERFEVIVVDDGSEDRTAEIAASFGVTMIAQAQRGPAAARNSGLAVALGEYLTVFDADDVMPPDRLAHQVAHLEGHPELGAVTGLTQAFVTPGEPRPAHYLPVWDGGPFPGALGTLMVRRSALQAAGGFDERFWAGEDVDWLARALDCGIVVGSIEQLCLRYRIHQGNITADREASRQGLLHALVAKTRRRRAVSG